MKCHRTDLVVIFQTFRIWMFILLNLSDRDFLFADHTHGKFQFLGLLSKLCIRKKKSKSRDSIFLSSPCDWKTAVPVWLLHQDTFVFYWSPLGQKDNVTEQGEWVGNRLSKSEFALFYFLLFFCEVTSLKKSA